MELVYKQLTPQTNPQQKPIPQNPHESKKS